MIKTNFTTTTNETEPFKMDIYYSTRIDTLWSQPQLFTDIINSEYREAGHSLTLDSTLYFSSALDGGSECHVYRSRCAIGEYTSAE